MVSGLMNALEIIKDLDFIFIEEAQSRYPDIADPQVLGPLLKRIALADIGAAEGLSEILSELQAKVGRPAQTAEVIASARAQSLVDATGCDFEIAKSRVYEQDPALYERHIAEISAHDPQR